MTTTEILTAFFERLDTLAYSPQPPIAWPGIKFEPPASGEWLEARVFPNEPTNLGWENAAAVESRGFCQVLVVYRPERGEIGASELADAVVQHFYKGTDLGPVKVRKMPTRGPSVEDGDKCFIPITIPYLGVCAYDE